VVTFKSIGIKIKSLIIHEAMTVSERPARHRSRSGEFPNSGTRKQAGVLSKKYHRPLTWLNIYGLDPVCVLNPGLPGRRSTFGGLLFRT